jgi:hypothetical protein
LTPKRSLQVKDQVLNIIYTALDPKVFESIKDLEFEHEDWKGLENLCEDKPTMKEVKLYISSKINMHSSRCKS